MNVRYATSLFALLFVFVVPFEKTVVLPGLGSLARIIGLLAALSWSISALVSSRVRKFSPFHILFFLFVLWNLASVTWSLDFESSLERVVTWFQLAFLVVIIWDTLDTREALRAALQAYVLGAWVSIVGTVYNYLQSSAFVYGRYSASGLHVVDLGVVLALGIPIAWYLVVESDRAPGWSGRYLKFVNVVYLPAACIGIALTGSRGAAIAALPSIVFMLSTMTRLRLLTRLLLLAIAAGGILVGQELIPQASLERLGSAYTELTSGGTLSGRVGLWLEGLELFAERPVLGIGTDAYKNTVELGQVAHNTFLSVLVELGLIGLALFLAILAVVARQAIRQPRLEATLWVSVLCGWMLGASTLTHEHYKTTWLMFSFVVISARNFHLSDKATDSLLVDVPSR